MGSGIRRAPRAGEECLNQEVNRIDDAHGKAPKGWQNMSIPLRRQPDIKSRNSLSQNENGIISRDGYGDSGFCSPLAWRP
jgi:hypothetical protein